METENPESTGTEPLDDFEYEVTLKNETKNSCAF